MVKTKNYFYNKFLNEENIKNLDDKGILKFFFYFLFIQGLSIASVTIITFGGYNFDDLFGAGAFIFTSIFFLIVIKCVWGFIKLDKKYHLFKKHWYLVVSLLSYLVLDLSFYIAAIFTTKFTIQPDDSVIIIVNPLFYLYIYLPIIFANIAFCYFAYIKGFSKYIDKSASNKIKSTGAGAFENKEETEIINEKELEDDPSDSNDS